MVLRRNGKQQEIDKDAIKLTTEQRNKIRDDMDSQVEMLSDEEIEYLATQLNGAVDIPFISEDTEQFILVKIVKKVDRYLYTVLPNEIYGLVKSTTDGLSDEEADQLIQVLSTRANQQVNIKYLPEWVEQEIFQFLIRMIVQGMRLNSSILTA